MFEDEDDDIIAGFGQGGAAVSTGADDDLINEYERKIKATTATQNRRGRVARERQGGAGAPLATPAAPIAPAPGTAIVSAGPPVPVAPRRRTQPIAPRDVTATPADTRGVGLSGVLRSKSAAGAIEGAPGVAADVVGTMAMETVRHPIESLKMFTTGALLTPFAWAGQKAAELTGGTPRQTPEWAQEFGVPAEPTGLDAGLSAVGALPVIGGMASAASKVGRAVEGARVAARAGAAADARFPSALAAAKDRAMRSRAARTAPAPLALPPGQYDLPGATFETRSAPEVRPSRLLEPETGTAGRSYPAESALTGPAIPTRGIPWEAQLDATKQSAREAAEARAVRRMQQPLLPPSAEEVEGDIRARETSAENRELRASPGDVASYRQMRDEGTFLPGRDVGAPKPRLGESMDAFRERVNERKGLLEREPAGTAAGTGAAAGDFFDEAASGKSRTRTPAGTMKGNLTKVAVEDLGDELARLHDANAVENTAPTAIDTDYGEKWVGMKPGAAKAAGRQAMRGKSIDKLEAEIRRRGLEVEDVLGDSYDRANDAERRGIRPGNTALKVLGLTVSPAVGAVAGAAIDSEDRQRGAATGAVAALGLTGLAIHERGPRRGNRPGYVGDKTYLAGAREFPKPIPPDELAKLSATERAAAERRAAPIDLAPAFDRSTKSPVLRAEEEAAATGNRTGAVGDIEKLQKMADDEGLDIRAEGHGEAARPLPSDPEVNLALVTDDGLSEMSRSWWRDTIHPGQDDIYKAKLAKDRGALDAEIKRRRIGAPLTDDHLELLGEHLRDGMDVGDGREGRLNYEGRDLSDDFVASLRADRPAFSELPERLKAYIKTNRIRGAKATTLRHALAYVPGDAFPGAPKSAQAKAVEPPVAEPHVTETPLDAKAAHAVAPVAAATVGATQGDTPEERKKNALLALGVGLGAAAFIVGRTALRKPKVGGEVGAKVEGRVVGTIGQQQKAQGERVRNLEPKPGKPVDPATVKPDEFVNLPKFALDEDGEKRLAEQVKRVVASKGLAPKKVVTWDETKAAGAALGLEPDRLMRQTRLSGAEMLGIRNIVKENTEHAIKLERQLATDGTLSDTQRADLDKTITALDHQSDALLAKFTRERSRTGRDLNNLKILAAQSNDPVVWMARAKRQLGEAPLTDDIRSEIVRLTNLEDPAQLAQYVANLKPATTWEKIITAWKAGLLTNPTTHMANAIGNVAMWGLERAKDVPAVVADRLLALSTGFTTKAPNLSDMASAAAEGAQAGLAKAKGVMQGNVASDLARLNVREIDFKNPILNAYTHTMFRSLSASDKVFRELALRQSIAEQARVLAAREGFSGAALEKRVGQLRAVPTDEMAVHAMEAADYATFQDNSPIAKAASGVRRAFGPVGDVVLPFTRTPGNVAMRTFEYTPAGALLTVRDLSKLLDGAGTPELQRQVVEQLGRSSIGTAAMIAGYTLAADGKWSGQRPTATDERATKEAEGLPDNAVKVGDRWYSLNRVSPIGNLLSVGGALYELAHAPDATGLDVLVGGVAAAGKSVADQTFLTGLSDAVDAVRSPKEHAGTFIRSLGTSVIPAGVQAAVRAAQGTTRDERGAELVDVVKSRAGASNLPVRRDVLGQPVERRGIGELVDPFSSRADRSDDPVIRELRATGASIGPLGKGKQTQTRINAVGDVVPGKPAEASSAFGLRSEAEGRILHRVLSGLVSNPGYQALSAEAKKAEIESVVKRTRAQMARQRGPG